MSEARMVRKVLRNFGMSFSKHKVEEMKLKNDKLYERAFLQCSDFEKEIGKATPLWRLFQLCPSGDDKAPFSKRVVKLIDCPSIRLTDACITKPIIDALANEKELQGNVNEKLFQLFEGGFLKALEKEEIHGKSLFNACAVLDEEKKMAYFAWDGENGVEKMLSQLGFVVYHGKKIPPKMKILNEMIAFSQKETEKFSNALAEIRNNDSPDMSENVVVVVEKKKEKKKEKEEKKPKKSKKPIKDNEEKKKKEEPIKEKKEKKKEKEKKEKKKDKKEKREKRKKEKKEKKEKSNEKKRSVDSDDDFQDTTELKKRKVQSTVPTTITTLTIEEEEDAAQNTIVQEIIVEKEILPVIHVEKELKESMEIITPPLKEKKKRLQSNIKLTMDSSFADGNQWFQTYCEGITSV